MPDKPSADQSPIQLPSEPNPHFVRALGELSEQKEVQLSEDVYSQNGSKLLAKGSRVTPDIYDKLIHHRLRSPLRDEFAQRTC